MSGPFSVPPQPDGVTTAAEFVAALGRLRQWSGLTYRQLTAAAKASGDVLPPSTIAGALGRTTLPREEFVAAFVRACGLGEAETVRWVAHRKRLAAGMARPADPHDAAAGPDRPAVPPEQPGPDGRPDQADRVEPGRLDGREQTGPPDSAGPGDPTEPADPAGPGADAVRPHTRALRRFVIAGAVVLVLLLATGTVLSQLRVSWAGGGARPSAFPTATTGSGLTPPSAAPAAGSGRTPPDGWYHIVPSHVADRDLCIGEGRERNRRTDRPLAVQRSCRDIVPDTYVQSVGGGAYEIQWHHPEQGVGCLTVDEALRGPDVLVAPENCSGAAHQRFLLKPAGAGFALRPLHSGLCLGALYGEPDVAPGAELAQESCTGRRDQVFLFRPAPAPTWTPR
ncbi:XRE family transcriptional regulator [Microbispora bryophytorum]|uniref:XRE family transcriptional regulator n=1 Tax=Microbispora bryophytorum subsp. camponoti TaxID=1677852 RepID=A0ABR8KYI8_9ACTN|nr:XRE family transcriptional regulator [Microbispora camponoti]MBD3143781.1 XRE family transcriptional regulator [Microbispora camponoti]